MSAAPVAWEYTFESAESEREALEILARRDRDGWEALSCSWARGGIGLFLRRATDTARPAPLGLWGHEDRVEDVG